MFPADDEKQTESIIAPKMATPLSQVTTEEVDASNLIAVPTSTTLNNGIDDLKIGDKVDSQDPLVTNNKKWIAATIIHKDENKIQIHYDNNLEPWHSDYVTDSDEDDWIEKSSNKIASLYTYTTKNIQLTPPSLRLYNTNPQLISVD